MLGQSGGREEVILLFHTCVCLCVCVSLRLGRNFFSILNCEPVLESSPKYLKTVFWFFRSFYFLRSFFWTPKVKIRLPLHFSFFTSGFSLPVDISTFFHFRFFTWNFFDTSGMSLPFFLLPAFHFRLTFHFFHFRFFTWKISVTSGFSLPVDTSMFITSGFSLEKIAPLPVCHFLFFYTSGFSLPVDTFFQNLDFV